MSIQFYKIFFLFISYTVVLLTVIYTIQFYTIITQETNYILLKEALD